MDKITFACMLDELQKHLNVHLDSDIISIIYKEYIVTFYHKYTLFQLISMMDMKDKYIACHLNKKAILKLIYHREYIFPDKNRYDEDEKTQWSVFNIKYLDYKHYPHVSHISMNIISIDNTCCRTEIMQGDSITVRGNTYKIHEIIDNKNMILLNCGDNSQNEMPIGIFIKMMDEEDVTIETNILREKKALSWYMDRKIIGRVV